MISDNRKRNEFALAFNSEERAALLAGLKRIRNDEGLGPVAENLISRIA